MPTSTINLTDSGASSPVLVRVYQLKGKDRFQQAMFKTLWKNDTEELGSDLVDRKEMTVYPDEKVDFPLAVDVKRGASYLAIMALFRQPDVEGWRQVVEARSSALNPMTPKLKIILHKNTIKLAD